MNHKGLDHLAVAVSDTEEALKVWRDRLGFPLLYSEVVNDGAVRLTHLDLGNTQLQLVEPLVEDHPLCAWLKEHGSGLHHFCLRVDDISESMAEEDSLAVGIPHQGTQGKKAIFLDKEVSGNVLVELTGA